MSVFVPAGTRNRYSFDDGVDHVQTNYCINKTWVWMYVRKSGIEHKQVTGTEFPLDLCTATVAIASVTIGKMVEFRVKVHVMRN